MSSNNESALLTYLADELSFISNRLMDLMADPMFTHRESIKDIVKNIIGDVGLIERHLLAEKLEETKKES